MPVSNAVKRKEDRERKNKGRQEKEVIEATLVSSQGREDRLRYFRICWVAQPEVTAPGQQKPDPPEVKVILVSV